MDTLRLLLTLAMVSFPQYCALAWTYFRADPREYCISTKDFVVDDGGKLKGLNTGTIRFTLAFFIKKIANTIIFSSCRMD